MNLSKILVSVNIAATLPLAVQVAAQAADQTVGNDAGANSSTAVQSNHRSSQVSVAKQNFKLVKAGPATLEVDGVKLRAFVPGRKLPSAASSQLVSQQAQFAPEQQAPALNATVSENYSRITQQSQYGAGISPYVSSSPRMVLNQVQAVARQLKSAAKKQNLQTAIKPTSIAPAVATKPLSATADFGQFSKDIPASWMANEKNLSVIEPPVTTPKEAAQIDRMIDQSRPIQATGTAGPAPFPLNLLPQQSLKQFVGARPQARQAAPQAFFGSWHGAAQPRIASSLAPGGFHSNLHGNFGSYAAPHASHKVAATSKQHIIAQAHHPVAPVAKVAAYAPYTTTASF